MSQTQQTHVQYCQGCGEMAIGQHTSGGMFYCNDCWKTAYQRQQQQYQSRNNNNNNNFMYDTNKYTNIDDFRSSRARKSGSSTRPIQLYSKPKEKNNIFDQQQQHILTLTQDNLTLRAQLNAALENNQQLQQENLLLNNLGDGIEKYDFMQLKEENDKLLDDAERLSIHIKKLLVGLKKANKINEDQHTQIHLLQSTIHQIETQNEETLNEKRDQLQQKDTEILQLREQLHHDSNAFPDIDAIYDSVRNTPQQFVTTINQKRYKKSIKMYTNEPKTPRKTRNFTRSKSTKERRGSNHSIHSVESASSHHSNLSLNKVPISILTSVGSKSALLATGYRDFIRNTSNPTIKSMPSLPAPPELKKKKPLPMNIGMVTPRGMNDLSENDSDIESLYESNQSRDTTPVSVHSVYTPRTYKAKNQNKRKGHGRTWRTTYEVQRDINTVKYDVFKQQNINESKAKRFQSNNTIGKYGKEYQNSIYANSIMTDKYSVNQ